MSDDVYNAFFKRFNKLTTEDKKRSMAYVERLYEIEVMEKLPIDILHFEKNGLVKGTENNDSKVPPPDPTCSFCGKSTRFVKSMIQGNNGVYICNECLTYSLAILELNNEVGCAFCGKKVDEVKRLFKGETGIFICNDCAKLCANIE